MDSHCLLQGRSPPRIQLLEIFLCAFRDDNLIFHSGKNIARLYENVKSADLSQGYFVSIDQFGGRKWNQTEMESDLTKAGNENKVKVYPLSDMVSLN
jgi:hypothetical protein